MYKPELAAQQVQVQSVRQEVWLPSVPQPDSGVHHQLVTEQPLGQPGLVKQPAPHWIDTLLLPLQAPLETARKTASHLPSPLTSASCSWPAW